MDSLAQDLAHKVHVTKVVGEHRTSHEFHDLTQNTHRIGNGLHDLVDNTKEVLDNTKAVWVNDHDLVGISFWIISIAMVAATYFFSLEACRLKGPWRTSLTVGALVTLVAAVNYFYMRDYWATHFESPIVYRYIDWFITVPLQMVEFFLILRAVGPVSGGVFWRLLIGSIVMLAFGYAGETAIIPAWPGFIGGCAGWFFILFEIHGGQASKIKSSADTPRSVQRAYNTMRSIVTIGWAVYPAGYFIGLIGHGCDATANGIYNVADFVNKIGFVLSIWAAAMDELEAYGY